MKIFVSFCEKLCITQILCDSNWDSFATITVIFFVILHFNFSVITHIFTSTSLYSASSHSPTCLKELIKKGKNHQDFAPDVMWRLSGMTNVSGGINLRIAATPHFVNIMTHSAMLQHIYVNECVLIAGRGTTPCNFVVNWKIAFFVANLAITQNGVGSTLQYICGCVEQKNLADVENV